ncbi:MAG TPA: ATP synthase F0 subunit B [Pyrinomonadaceae bacterium]|nr:ATP synthase F0 subunit B [Pyrinomonadaceae bacterium]
MLSFILLPEWIEYLNYPGLEIWKFADLAIFVGVAIYILRKPITQALAARRESIRKQILAAQEERDSAAAKLAETEAMLARVDDEVDAVRRQAREEAELERQRQVAAAELEMQRLKTQGERELEIARKLAHRALQQFLASRSVEVAKQSVMAHLSPDDDARLIRDRVTELTEVRG